MADLIYTRITCRDLHDTGAGEWCDPITGPEVGCIVTVCGLIAHENDDYVSVTVAYAQSETDDEPHPRGALHIPKATIILRRDKPFILDPDYGHSWSVVPYDVTYDALAPTFTRHLPDGNTITFIYGRDGSGHWYLNDHYWPPGET